MYVLTTKKHPITHGTCTRDTRHEARCARKLGYYMPPKLVPAQGTQSCGKPCCFRRDRYYDEQKNNILKNGGSLVDTKLRLKKKTRDTVLSTPAEKKALSARHTRHTARIAPKARRLSPDGLPLSTSLASARTVRLRRDTSEKVLRFHVDIHMLAGKLKHSVVLLTTTRGWQQGDPKASGIRPRGVEGS